MSEQYMVVPPEGGRARRMDAPVVRLPEPFSGPQSIDRLPDVVNISTYAGDDLSFALVVLNYDGSEPDLSAAQVRAQIRQTPAAQQIAGSFAVSAEENLIYLHLLGSVSQDLPGQAVWDCELTYEGRVTTLVAGTVRTTPDVTR